MKRIIILLIALMILPCVSADIIDTSSPSVHSAVVNLEDFPDYTFVMVYEAPHVSRGPSFIYFLGEDGSISETNRYGSSATLYAIESSKLEDNYLYELWDKIEQADIYTTDILTDEAKEYLLDEGMLLIDYLIVRYGGYGLGVVEIEYTLHGLDAGNYTITKNGRDITPGSKNDSQIDTDDDSILSYPYNYFMMSLIALIIICYLVYNKKPKKSKRGKR